MSAELCSLHLIVINSLDFSVDFQECMIALQEASIVGFSLGIVSRTALQGCFIDMANVPPSPSHFTETGFSQTK